MSSSYKNLVTNGSIELSTRPLNVIDEATDYLPFGKRVYIPALPNYTLASSLDIIAKLHENGFEAVPHIAAKRLSSSNELKIFLEQAVAEYDVRRVLLIGGDINRTLGPYQNSADVLKDGVLQNSGIIEVGLAAYPEGHPRINQKILNTALHEKLKILSDSKIGAYIVTQFSFAPARIIELCSALKQDVPGVPVYVGMAGPTDPIRLFRYAKLCGVTISLRALVTLGFKAAKLVTKTGPDDQLMMLAKYCNTTGESNVIGIHLFSFGGFIESAMWKHQKL